MHIPTIKKNKNRQEGKCPKVGLGHPLTRNGAGPMKLKCDRRQGTRSQATARIIGEW